MQGQFEQNRLQPRGILVAEWRGRLSGFNHHRDVHVGTGGLAWENAWLPDVSGGTGALRI